MARIGIDVDGVLANFTNAWVQVANRLYPGRVPMSFVPDDWDMNGKWTKVEQNNIWKRIKATENFWLGLDAYSENVGAMARFLVTQSDHDVYLVTSRVGTAGMTTARQTDWWIRSCGITPVRNYLGIIVADDSDAKYLIYQHAGITYSIDDKAETVEQCDGINPALYDHKAYLLDRQWNQHAKVQRRVKTLDEFLKDIK